MLSEFGNKEAFGKKQKKEKVEYMKSAAGPEPKAKKPSKKKKKAKTKKK